MGTGSDLVMLDLALVASLLDTISNIKDSISAQSSDTPQQCVQGGD